MKNTLRKGGPETLNIYTTATRKNARVIHNRLAIAYTVASPANSTVSAR
jgi:hypothetical protein